MIGRGLLVGDPHATARELKDCGKLVDLISQVAVDRHLDFICLLGDQHHDHALVHVEVIRFWADWLASITKQVKRVFMLVGNHDRPTTPSMAHALRAYRDISGVTVVDKPMVVGGQGLLPYQADRDVFIEDCHKLYAAGAQQTIVCHQTFSGAAYESGIYAPDGIDPTLVPQTKIVSGHIHTPQSFGKVHYPGAPRWRTLSDANVERSLWEVSVSEDGVLSVVDKITTGNACRQIYHAVLRPTDAVPIVDEVGEWHVDLVGPEDWTRATKNSFQGSNIHVRCFNDVVAGPAVRESDGVAKALDGWLDTHHPKNQTPIPVLKAEIRSRL